MPPKRKAVEIDADDGPSVEIKKEDGPVSKIAKKSSSRKGTSGGIYTEEQLFNQMDKEQKELYQHMLRYGKGVPTDQVALDLGITQTELHGQMNKAMRLQLVKTFKEEGVLHLKANPIKDLLTTVDLTADEQMVFDYIKNSGTEGIWTRHLRGKTSLAQMVLTNVLKNLEKKQMVKTLRSVKFPTRKLYMLYSLTPSEEVSGGPWYTDQELDLEFINTLYEACLRYIKDKSFPKGRMEYVHPPEYRDYPSAKEITQYISKSGLLKDNFELSVKELERLLDVLVYDKKVVKVSMAQFNDDEDDEEVSSADDSERDEAMKDFERDEEMKDFITSDSESDDANADYDGKRKRNGTDRKKGKRDHKPKVLYKALRKVPDLAPEEIRRLYDDEPKSGSKVGAEIGDVGFMAAPRRLGKSLTETPCGKCPVFDFCSETGPVNPRNCEYLHDWLYDEDVEDIKA